MTFKLEDEVVLTKSTSGADHCRPDVNGSVGKIIEIHDNDYYILTFASGNCTKVCRTPTCGVYERYLKHLMIHNRNGANEVVSEGANND